MLLLPTLIVVHSLLSSRGTLERSSQVLDATAALDAISVPSGVSRIAVNGAEPGLFAASRASSTWNDLDPSGGGGGRNAGSVPGGVTVLDTINDAVTEVQQQQQQQQQQKRQQDSDGSQQARPSLTAQVDWEEVDEARAVELSLAVASRAPTARTAAALPAHGVADARTHAHANPNAHADGNGNQNANLNANANASADAGGIGGAGEGYDGSERFYRVTGEGDYCAGESHWKWSFLCAAAEARLLNRTLVLPLARCMDATHTLSNVTEEKPMALYYNMDHWPRIQPIMLDLQFELRFGSLNATILRARHNMSVHEFQAREPTSRLESAEARGATLIVRQARFAYEICALPGNAKHLVRNYNLIQRPKYLWRVAEAIQRSMGFGYVSVHVRRGDKLNRHFWPHLDRDTRPDALLKTLPKFIQPGRHVYIASNERTPGFFSPLASLYKIHVLSDYRHLWAPGSDWYKGCRELMERHRIKLGAEPVFDAQMQWIVDEILMSQAKKRVETFFDLTNDTRHAM
ncbi:hypothetical protein CLOM_g8745 [Closterium sp. NIES-68]|nr:hypothetical protein CLOM_g8745 [Closterium sp. NIES-68]GJP64772.1 hypothetical protein CLOP_g21720 [Closterium sp. NIES-67]